MKMVKLKSEPMDSAVSNRALGAPDLSTNNDGADLHINGEHLKQLGMDDGLPHGHDITVTAHGTVHRSESGPDGGRMHVKLHKMGVDYDEPKERKERSLRDDLNDSTKKSEHKADDKAAKKQFGKVEKDAQKADVAGNE